MAVLLVLALVTPLFSPFFRRVKVEDGDTEDLPSVSIVIVEHDSAFRLKEVLPRYLSQNYPADYQVIVVIDKSDSESEDVLKLHHDNPHLYYTKLPDSSRYISRKKLGITLGMRAAKYDWVIVTDVHSYPENEDWLSAVASHCGGEDTHMVLGLTPYEEESPRYYRFEQLRTMLYCMREAQRGNAFATNQSMVMMRKSDFFEGRGFEGNLEYSRAEFEFLVNKFSTLGNVAFALEPRSWLTQFSPKPSRRIGRLLYALNAMKALDRTGMYKLLYRMDLTMVHLFNFLTILAVIVGAVSLCSCYEVIPAIKWIHFTEIESIALIASVVIFWIVSIIERCIIYRPSLSYFSDINSLTAVIMEWGMSSRRTFLRIRYIFTKKTDFITHKL